jgi:hypothetical protein
VPLQTFVSYIHVRIRYSNCANIVAVFEVLHAVVIKIIKKNSRVFSPLIQSTAQLAVPPNRGLRSVMAAEARVTSILMALPL